MNHAEKQSSSGRGAEWPHKRLWRFVRSLHPVQLVGFSIGSLELTGYFVAGRPIDKEVMPFAAAMVLWQSLKSKADK